MPKSLTHRTCASCGKHREGKIYKFEGRYFCDDHWREMLIWHENRGNLTMALQTGSVLGVSLTDRPSRIKWERLRHQAHEAASKASFALRYGTRQDFVRAFVRAMRAHEEMR